MRKVIRLSPQIPGTSPSTPFPAVYNSSSSYTWEVLECIENGIFTKEGTPQNDREIITLARVRLFSDMTVWGSPILL